MIRSVSIRNFRGLRQLETPLDAVTAFMGPNSSGKTSVLHAIRLACTLLGRAVESDRPARPDATPGWISVTEGTLLGDVGDLLSLKEWRALFVDQEVGEGTAFRVKVEFDPTDPIRTLEVQVACARNEQLKLTVRVESPAALAPVAHLPKKSPNINRQLTDYLSTHSPRAVFIPPFYGTVPVEELRAKAAIDRLLGSGDQSHVVRNLVTGLDHAQFERLNAFLRDTVGAQLTSRTSGDALQTEPSLRVHFRDSNGDIELSAAGAGLVNLIALYAALSRWQGEADQRRLIFLLDEPEAHLHPRLQAESTARLARLVTQDFSAQLVVATHSVDILNRLSQEGARLVRIDRTQAQSAVQLTGDATLFDDLAGWVDLTPYTAINALAARRILFVEGDDEVRLLPLLGGLRFRNDLTRHRLFRAWAILELRGASNAPVAAFLARLVQNRAIRDTTGTGPFRVVVALDRDYERTPGVVSAAADGVSSTTIIWPVHSLESMFLASPVLTRWVRAFLGPTAPIDLDNIVRASVEEADRDEELNQKAIGEILAAIVAARSREGVSLTADHGRVVKDASAEAQRRVAEDPAAWQRGKDRAAAVLGRIRAGLAGPQQASFPTNIVKLIERTNLNLIGDPVAALPTEVNDLLERMTQP